MFNSEPPSAADDLFENAPCAQVVMEPSGRITRANATAVGWMGYTPDQLVGTRFHDLLTVGTRILYETSFAPQLSMTGLCEEMSLDLRTATGQTIAVSASGRVRMDSVGRPVSTQLALFKASERRRYERQLVDAQTKAETQERTIQRLLATERETSELREQFIAVLGHDLRNPLTSISGGLRLLKKNPAADRRNFLFSALEGSVQRMASLIDNVLDFARGRLGEGIPHDLREVDVAPILDQVVAELRIGLADRVIVTDLDLTAKIRCDPSRLSQLVSNLLGNALTHGAEGQPVNLHADDNGGVLTIWVANSGLPIPEETVERLFQPFFRGKVRASQQGLGLGLHIASEIAKAHHGNLTVTSAADETRFTFRMPAASDT